MSYQCPLANPNPLTCSCTSCTAARQIHKSKAMLREAERKNFAPRGSSMPVNRAVTAPEPRRETTREKVERQRRERYAQSEEDWKYVQANEDRYAQHRADILARRAGENAYEFTEQEWNQDLSDLAKRYEWDLSQQRNVSVALLTIQEANEYLDLLIQDTHGTLSTGKDYAGLATGLKGAQELAKELGGWGATAKAVEINGAMHIVIENYKPRYLDLGPTWKKATPYMLKIGHALNTVKGNVHFIKGYVYAEIIFSGAVNVIDYALHNEKTLGEVTGEFLSDVAKGVSAGAIAHGITIGLRQFIATAFFAPPTAAVLGFFVIAAFAIGKIVSNLDEKYNYTEPMKNEIKRLIDES